MSIIDIIMNNTDRHDNNWMVAFDKTDDSMIISPIDHSLSRIPDNADDFMRQLESSLSDEIAYSGDVYALMEQLSERMGEERMQELYNNEVSRLVTNLSNPLFMPKGRELQLIISNFGSYENFLAVVTGGLQEMTKPGTRLNNLFKQLAKAGFWRT